MERKDFLKKLGLGAMAVAVFPKLMSSKTQDKLLDLSQVNPINIDEYDSSVSRHMPHIITITNCSMQDQHGITFLDASNKNKVNYGLPTSVTIESGRSDVTYKDVLDLISKNGLVIGLTYIQSSTYDQVLQCIHRKQKDGNDHDMVPVLDCYQNQSGVIALKEKYLINTNTSFVLKKLYANTSVRIYIYPLSKKTNESKDSSYIMSV